MSDPEFNARLSEPETKSDSHPGRLAWNPPSMRQLDLRGAESGPPAGNDGFPGKS
jgi:hypothetical protein